jgi:uncharacterized protein Smg (DUF494 family)
MADVLEVLTREKGAILDTAVEAVERSNLRHYTDAGNATVRGYLETLFDLAITCIDSRNLVPMIEHADLIAHQRFEAGFDIQEVQTAFNVLEETVWSHVIDAIPPRDLAEAIGLVSTVLGAGRDTLARTYVELASKQHVPSLDLSALFRGGR